MESEGPHNERTVVHMDLDSFFVSVSRLEHPGLMGKPVIVGGSSDRGPAARGGGARGHRRSFNEGVDRLGDDHGFCGGEPPSVLDKLPER